MSEFSMGNKPLISAVITSYKRTPEVVERALKSILSQTYENLEIIVVDDSPADFKLRDQVRDTVIKYGDKVKYIRHEKNMGACVARNTGIDNSKGEYLAFLDDDDVWDKDKIKLQFEKMQESDAGLVYCDDILLNEVTDEKSKCNNVKFYRGNVYDILMKGNFIGGVSFPLIKRECFDTCGKFDPQQPAAQDYDMWVRIAEKYEIDYVDKPLVIYYVHEGECITKNPSKRIKGHERLLEKHRNYLRKHPKILAIRKRYIAVLYAQGGRLSKCVSSLFCAYAKDFFNTKENFAATKKAARQYIKSIVEKRKNNHN